MTHDHDALRRDLAQAIGEQFVKHDGTCLLGPWVVIAATSGLEDGRGLWLMSGVGEDDEAKPWEALGLLRHAEHLEQARTIREYDIE